MTLQIKKSILFKTLLLWCFFCSFFLAFVYFLFPVNINLLFLKDAFILLIFVLSLKFTSKIDLVFFYIILFVLFATLLSLTSKAPLMAKVTSLRQMIIPFILVLVGVNLGDRLNLNSLKKFIVNVAVFCLFFGFIEILFSIWHYINITNYFHIKNIPTYNLSYTERFHYPVFFIEPILGGLKRMTSFILDPINLGHTFAFIISLLMFDEGLIKKRDKKYALILFFAIGLCLTFSKGAILQLILTIFFVTKKISLSIKLIIVGLLCVLLIHAANFHDGIKIHLDGLVVSLSNINLFGHGLGTVGNQAAMFGNPILKIGDTYFGSILGQIGVVGYLLWFLPFFVIIRRVNYNLIAKIFLAQILISMISENSFNLLSIFLVCTFLGIYYVKFLKNSVDE